MKNMPKLRKLARLALLSTAFPIYQLEIKTNREIELTFANENVEERRGYQRKREVRSMQHI